MTRKKYTFEQRLEVVKHYLSTDDGYRIISARFDVPRTEVRMWIALYQAHGEAGLKPKNKGVSAAPDLRVQVVKAVIDKPMSLNQAAAYFNLSGSAVISKWLKIYTQRRGCLAFSSGRKK